MCATSGLTIESREAGVAVKSVAASGAIGSNIAANAIAAVIDALKSMSGVAARAKPMPATLVANTSALKIGSVVFGSSIDGPLRTKYRCAIQPIAIAAPSAANADGSRAAHSAESPSLNPSPASQ